MPLPPRLQRYDRLIDYLVEELVRETQEEAEMKTPAGLRIPAGADVSQTTDRSGDDSSVPPPS